MPWRTWWAIARRQMAYMQLLQARLAEWTDERINACTDLVVLAHVERLNDRYKRHEARMERHEHRVSAIVDMLKDLP